MKGREGGQAVRGEGGRGRGAGRAGPSGCLCRQQTCGLRSREGDSWRETGAWLGEVGGQEEVQAEGPEWRPAEVRGEGSR